MALWEQGGSSTGAGFHQRKAAAADGDNANGQRSTIKGVLTCTIATILNAKHSESDNCYVYKHLKFNTVMVMGFVRQANHDNNGSLATYQIEDNSGDAIEIKWWHEDSGEPMKPMTYIKVIGQVKTFAGKSHIVAHHISKMQSLNELITHSIECVHSSLLIRKQNELTGGTHMPTNKQMGNGNTGYQSQQTSNASNGFTPIQNAVLNHLKTATTMAGFSRTDICKQLRQFSENQVQQALEFLSGEGHIYSTTDDDHFRAASDN